MGIGIWQQGTEPSVLAAQLSAELRNGNGILAGFFAE